jgi:hypothetical protein
MQAALMRAVLACLVVGGTLGLGALAIGDSLAEEVRVWSSMMKVGQV